MREPHEVRTHLCKRCGGRTPRNLDDMLTDCTRRGATRPHDRGQPRQAAAGVGAGALGRGAGGNLGGASGRGPHRPPLPKTHLGITLFITPPSRLSMFPAAGRGLGAGAGATSSSSPPSTSLL